MPPAYANPDCPTLALLDRLSDKWAILVLAALAERPTRFGDLRRALGASQKMTTATLRALERDGLVARTVQARPLAVDYALTPLARSLQPILQQLEVWAETHRTELKAARTTFDPALAA